MLFMARNNRLYRLVGHMTTMRRYLLTCCICAGIFFCWFFIFYYPLHTSNLHYTQEYETLFKKYNETSRTQRDIKELQFSYDALVYDTNVHKQIRTEQYFKTALHFLFDCAQQAGMLMNTYSFVSVHEKDWYRKEKYHFEFIGSIQQILTFLSLIKSSQKMIKCHTLSLSSVERDLYHIACEMQTIAVTQ